jgi:hypothetical protein
VIIPLDRRPVSFSGHSLQGSNLVRLAYLDEAGINAGDPIAVVAALIVHADRQWKVLHEHLGEIRKQFLPPEDRNGFVFHAKDVFHGSRYFHRDRWPYETRLSILKAMLSVINDVGVSLVVGLGRLQIGANDDAVKIQKEMHLVAYVHCLAGIEQFMRLKAPEELATLIAENTTEMQQRLKRVHHGILSLRSDRDIPGPELIREFLPLRHIIEAVHFSGKLECDLLQYSDVFAFSFYRYLARKPRGNRFAWWLLYPRTRRTT